MSRSCDGLRGNAGLRGGLGITPKRGKSPNCKRKSPENQWFSGLGGGDKRDRTADLLNAMSAIREQNEF